jgi:ubiquinone/menaquinone biosynthesis C-methylase UbiE
MPIDRVLEPEVMDSQEDAVDYDTMDHSEVNRVFVDDLLSVLPHPPDPNDQRLDLLDLGTGTALIPVELCKRFERCRVLAVDAAAHMLDLARYHLEANSLTGRIQLAQADAKALPFDDAQFDVVISNSIIHHIPEPLAVMQQAIRVLRPGGLLFFRDLLRPDSQEELQRLVATYAADCNDHQRQLFADSLHAALSLEEIRGLAGSLGLSRDSVQQTSDRHWTLCASARGAITAATS